MSADCTDMRISTGVTTPTSEVDIAICPTNLCRVLAAANDATVGGGPQKIFYSVDCGLTWSHSTFPQPPFLDEHSHSHPSVAWTSNQTVWLLTIATTTSGTTSLRCYNSIDNGVNWKREDGAHSRPVYHSKSTNMD